MILALVTHGYLLEDAQPAGIQAPSGHGVVDAPPKMLQGKASLEDPPPAPPSGGTGVVI